MGGELGNESNIDVLPGSSATPTPIFASIENDDFVAKFVLKNLAFLSFRRYHVETESEYKNVSIFIYFFFLRVQCSVRVSASKFQVQIRSGSRDTIFGWFIHFSAGPAGHHRRWMWTPIYCGMCKHTVRADPAGEAQDYAWTQTRFFTQARNE